MADLHTPRSLIITLYGAYGRGGDGGNRGDGRDCGDGRDRVDGDDRGDGRDCGDGGDRPLPVSALIRLLAAVGVDAPSVRSAVSRLKRRGLLVSARTAQGAAGYALSGDARQLLDDGDRRIYGRAVPRLADGWVLAVFSVPEAERAKRHVLRSRLAGLGFGTAAPGVWIAPGGLYEETRHTLERLQLTEYVDLFRGEHLGFAATAESVARWWDLPGIAAQHEAFLERHEPVLREWESGTTAGAAGASGGIDGGGAYGGAEADAYGGAEGGAYGGAEGGSEACAEKAYRDYLLALDSWRRLPYADPGLPVELLPSNWPGGRSAEVFAQLHSRLRDAGAAFVRP